MSNLKEKLTKEVTEIDRTISNPEEKEKVLNVLQEMIRDFTGHIIRLTERQNELEEKLDEVHDMLSDIQEEIVDALAEDMQAECPYCGEIIPLKWENGEFVDFECPECHNMIEMEMMFDEHGCDCDCEDCESLEDENLDDCDGNCGHCGGCSSEDEE